MNLFLYQLKQAAVNLQQKPVFVFSIVSSLGLALGVLLSVLTLAYVMLIKPLPYPEQHLLYQVEQQQIDNTGAHNVSGFNYPGLVDFYQKQTIFEQAALIDYSVSTLVSHPDGLVIHSSFITPEWFNLLGARMEKGRFFSAEEGLNSNAQVAVISFAAWQRLFDGDENILGANVSTQNKHYKVIGVLAQDFIEPALDEIGYQSDFFFPWDFNSSNQRQREAWWGRAHSRSIIGKLNQNLTPLQAEQTSSAYVNTKWHEHIVGEDYFVGWRLENKLHLFAEKIVGGTDNAVYLLVISVAFLVLIALMNIANLLLSRLAENHHSFSIHASLGASPKAIFKILLIDSGILTLLALIVAMIVSAVGCTLLQTQLASALPRVNELAVSGFTFAAAVVVGLVVMLVFSLLGARSINFRALNQGLVSSGKGNTAQVSVAVRKMLVVTQVAIATLLIFSASTIGLKAYQQVTFDDGMNAERLLSLQLMMYADNLPDADGRDVLLEQLKHSLNELPQVENVSRSSSPLTGSLNSWSLLDLDSMERVVPKGRSIDHHYFSLSGQKLIEGELFTESQVKDKAQQLIINEQLAKLLAPSGSALGKRLSFGTSANSEHHFKVVGVVTGHKMPGADGIPPRVYRPLNNAFNMTIELKSGQSLAKHELLATMAKVSPIFRIFKFESLAAMKSERLFAYQLALYVTLAITLVSTLLTFIGLYGILSFSSQMRRTEIGTRMALGAKGRDIVRLIVKDNVRYLVAGSGLGLVVLIGIYWAFQSRLAEFTNASVLPVFVVTLLFIAVISFIACYLPLRRYIKKPVVESIRGSG